MSARLGNNPPGRAPAPHTLAGPLVPLLLWAGRGWLLVSRSCARRRRWRGRSAACAAPGGFLLAEALAGCAAGPGGGSDAAALRAATGLHLSRHAADGTVLADTRPPEAPLPAEAVAAAAEVAAGRRLVSPLVADPASGGHALLLATPLPGPAGAGFWTLAVPAARLRDALVDAPAAGFGPDYGPALADAEGRIVARWRGHETLVGRNMPPEAATVLRRRRRASGMAATYGQRVEVGMRFRLQRPRGRARITETGCGRRCGAPRRPSCRPVALLLMAALGISLVARRIAGRSRCWGRRRAAWARAAPRPPCTPRSRRSTTPPSPWRKPPRGAARRRPRAT